MMCPSRKGLVHAVSRAFHPVSRLGHIIKRLDLHSPIDKLQPAVELLGRAVGCLQPSTPGAFACRVVANDSGHKLELVVELPADHGLMVVKLGRQRLNVSSARLAVETMIDARTMPAHGVSRTQSRFSHNQCFTM